MGELQLPICLTSTARAKVNLRLMVLGPRDDGFHAVSTLLHPIDLADEVTVTVSHARAAPSVAGSPDLVTVTCSDPGLAGPGNLAYSAARAWSAARSVHVGSRLPELRIEIAIGKRIPVAAGLGGGSADAAAVLHCLQRVHPLPDASLLRVATELGSDVPFFLCGRAAVGRGRGERLTGVTSQLDLPLVLALPSFGVAARDAYRWWDEDGEKAHEGKDPLADLESGRCLDARLLAEDGFCSNDLTAPVARRHPAIAELVSALRSAGALAAEMTGSGSAVYGVFPDLAGGIARTAASLAEEYPCVRWLLLRTVDGGEREV